MSGNKKEFKARRLKNRPFAFIGASLIVSILAFILVKYIMTIVPPVLLYQEFIIPVFIGICAGFLIVITDQLVTVEIDDESFTYTKGNKSEKYPLDAFAGTNIVNHYTNGAYSGSDRYLKFKKPNGTIKQIVVPFKEDEFSDIVSLITKNRRSDEETEEISNKIRESFSTGERIDIPKDAFAQAFKSSSRTRIIIGIIFVVISVATCVVAFLKLDLAFFIAVAVLVGFFGPALAVSIYFYGRKETKKALSDTPSYVSFEPSNLIFENDKYDASDIRKIVAVPFSYDWLKRGEVEFRTIVITDSNFSEHRYCFGRAPKDDKKMVFEGYKDLICLLEAWCFANNIEIRYKLG